MKDQTFGDTPGRRAAAYWYIDGLPELVAGIGFAVVGGCAIWFEQRQAHSWSDRAVFFALGLLALALVFGFDRSVVTFLKSRVTFPRTGYVRPPLYSEQTSQSVTSLGLSGHQRLPDQNVTSFRTTTLNVVICGNLLAGAIPGPAALPIAMSVVAFLLYRLHRNSERPYHWASVLPLPVAGLGAMLLRGDQNTNAWAAVLIGGAWLVGQGVWRLVGYTHAHPRCQSAESVRS